MPRLATLTLLTIGLLTLLLAACLMMARRERPRSEWLAFTNYSDSDLYLVKTDGTLRRVTTDIVYYPLEPVWTWTRGWLLYSINGNVNRVRLSNGQSESFLETPTAAFYHPTPSKNGHWVYYVQASTNGTEIWRHSTGGRTQQLTHFYARQMVVEEYTLSPDEQWLAVWVIDTQNLAMARQLLVFPIGGNPHPIITDAIAVDSVAWSPDGAWLLMVYQAQDGPKIVRVRRDGSERQTLYQFTGRDATLAADWSPDGRWVAYNAPCQPDLTFVGCLWVASTRDWQARVIYNFGNGQAIYRGYVGTPRWSPDSQTLAFAQPDTQNRGLRSLYQIGLDGGKPTRLAQPILGDEFAWSPLLDFGDMDGWTLLIGVALMVGGGVGWKRRRSTPPPPQS